MEPTTDITLLWILTYSASCITLNLQELRITFLTISELRWWSKVEPQLNFTSSGVCCFTGIRLITLCCSLSPFNYFGEFTMTLTNIKFNEVVNRLPQA